MKCPPMKKGETKKEYVTRCHLAVCKHRAIGKKIGWSTGYVREVAFENEE